MATSVRVTNRRVSARPAVRAALPTSTGDPDEWSRFVAAHQHRIARLAQRLLAWPADVDDVVQDVFLRALTKGAGYRAEGEVEAWLGRITVNCCRAELRRRRLRLRIFRSGDEAEIEAPTASDAGRHDHNAAIRAAIRRLPPRYREVIVLRYLEQWPIERIAATLRSNRNAIEARLSRARRRLEPELSELRHVGT